jgi:hypothetical protein
VNQQSPLDKEPYLSLIIRLIREGLTNASIVRELSIGRVPSGDHTSGLAFRVFTPINATESSIRRFRKRHNINPDGVQRAFTRIKDDEAEAATEPEAVHNEQDLKRILTDPDMMLRQRGLDPDDWEITSLTPNMWDGPVKGGGKVTYYQTKFTCKRRKPTSEMIMAPRTDGWVRPSTVNVVRHLEGQSSLVVILGDQQAPFHDKDLHAKTCAFLRYTRPSALINLGDTIDLPDIRPGHRIHPAHTAHINECLQSGYDIERGYIDASPNMVVKMLYGNHCERMLNILTDAAQAEVRNLVGIKRPDTPESKGEELLTLEHAMRMDELGIKVVKPDGPYTRSAILLTDKLAVRHGWIARKGSGSSALATLEHLGYNVIVGHTHRQSQVFKTVHEITGETRTLTAVEAGCMCRVSQVPDPVDGRVWPGYTDEPDWQQGFVTASIWPDGFFKIDLATYVNGTLLYKDQRF